MGRKLHSEVNADRPICKDDGGGGRECNSSQDPLSDAGFKDMALKLTLSQDETFLGGGSQVYLSTKVMQHHRLSR